MRSARFSLVFGLLATTSTVLVGCGTAEVQGVVESAEDGAALDAGLDTGVADTAANDTGPADTGAESQCINKFDCLKLDLKGQTPCTVPDCVEGQCVFVAHEEGAKCDDPTQTGLDECLETRCDANAECKAAARPDGAACEGDATTLDECQVTACVAGKCGVTNKPDATLCGVGACKHCKEGLCAVKSADDLDDGNPCTLDSCDVNSGEQHKKVTDITAVCDDGDSCTGDGTCLDGACKASPLDCDDGLTCTADTCGDKGCEHTANDTKCSDEDPCLEIGCDLAAGCTTTKVNVDEKCSDGDDECTKDDACDEAGLCAGTPVCGCKEDADCLGDGGVQKNLCKPQICDLGDDGKGLCVADLSAVVTCTDDGSSCSDIGCDPKSGDCATTATNEGKDCDDGNKCTTKPLCKEGECVGVVDETKCDDANPCTLDSCAPTTGCEVEPASGACDDGNQCTDNDLCAKGGCAGEEKACDDGIACTKDACDLESGKCTNTAEAKLCDDNNACTADICDVDGATDKGCVNKPDDAAKCEDDNKCTVTECKSGQCIVKEYDKTIAGCACTSDAACDDDNPCTIDKCDAGDCKSDAAAMNDKACDTGNICHKAASGVCKAGACSGGAAKDCSGTADQCHTAVCNNKTGQCEKVQKPEKSACDADGSKCTEDDSCLKGVCTAGAKKNCGDGDQCNDPTCAKETGACTTTPKKAGQTCEDNNICTENDACDASGKCKAGPALNCSSKGDQCNKGVCDQADGCIAVSKGDNLKCDDKQFCTKTDTCNVATLGGKKVGTCVGSGVPDCAADANKCQVAFCDSKANKCAIKAAPPGSTCSDGSKCTLNDTCQANGSCKAGPAKTCSGDQCNTPTCSAATGACGLKPLAAGTKCSDGNQCTTVDACSAGKCVGSKPVVCKDSACATSSCNPKSGSCDTSPKKDGTSCTDGEACTAPDECAAGACKGLLWTCGCKTHSDCDDGNKCTANVCVKGSDGKLSCKKSAKTGALCDDGNKCTVSDKCQSNESCKGSTKSCNDGNQCTADACNVATGGCVYKSRSGEKCTDGKLCTDPDTCNSSNVCVGKAISCNDGNLCTNDSCTASTGKCANVANTVACNDGALCTTGDKCTNKVCKGTLKTCSDATKCTSDVCNPKTGGCSNPPDTKYNNQTCEKGSASRCWNGSCLCSNWTASSGSTASTDYEVFYDTARDGDYTVSVGYKYSYNAKTKQYSYYGYVARHDRYGKEVWNKSFSYGDVTKPRVLYRVVRNVADKKWIAVGYTYTGTTYGNDGWVIEFNDSGTLYRNVYKRPGAESYHKGKKSDYLRGVAVDKNGEVYVAGYSSSSVSSGRQNAWLMKLKKYSSYTYTTTWSRLKTDATYNNAYYDVGYSSPYDRAVAVGYTYTKLQGQNGLVSSWSNAGVGKHYNYGDATTYNQSLTRVATYSAYYVAVGTFYQKANSNQGWILSGYGSSGGKYKEGIYGGTSSDSLNAVVCPGTYCYSTGRAYDTTAKKYKLWSMYHYYLYAHSMSKNTMIDVGSTVPYPAGLAYRSSSELITAGGASSNGWLMQYGYTSYQTCSGGTKALQ